MNTNPGPEFTTFSIGTSWNWKCQRIGKVGIFRKEYLLTNLFISNDIRDECLEMFLCFWQIIKEERWKLYVVIKSSYGIKQWSSA